MNQTKEEQVAAPPPSIRIDPTSALARALAVADGPIVLESGGVRYRVEREPDSIFAGYDPERVGAAFRSVAGILEGVDTEALINELREQRGQDSSGRPA
jgi:hypothetical protein